MTKIGKRIIIIAIPVAVSAVLLLSSVFSAAKFNTFNCFSSFPAFFGIISGSENVTEIDGGKIIMCPPADSVEKLADYLKDKGIERDPENDMGGRISLLVYIFQNSSYKLNSGMISISSILASQ